MRATIGKLFLTGALALAALAGGQAAAATAKFTSQTQISDSERVAFSTQGDNAGYLLALNQTIGIRLDTPIAASINTTVSIFTLPPSSGSAHATISFGSYNNGSPVLLMSKSVKAGKSVDVKNLLSAGCAVFGGCDYIEITTTKAKKGAKGVEIDYILVDGEIVEVTGTSPEPSVWALMIIGFSGIAARLKAVRRNRARAGPHQAAYSCA